MEGATFSAVSAGLTAGINVKLPQGDMQLIAGFGSDQLTLSGLVNAGLDGVITSGLSSAVYGTEFGDGILRSLVTYVANGAAGASIEDIGDFHGHDTFTIEKFVAKATVNCLAAEAKGASCASGALGSLVAETLAKNTVASGKTLSAADLDQLAKDIEIVSAVVGFVASGGDADNVNATITAAELDHENNWIWLAVRAGVFAWTVFEVVDAANSLSADFDRLFADGELTEAEARELQQAAADMGISIVFEVTAGKAIKGMKVAAIAGDFSVSVAKKLGLDKVLADLNKKMGGVGKNVNEGDVGQYQDLAQRSVKDGLTPDHIPSFAATRQAVNDAGLDLSDSQLEALRNNTNCVVVRTCDHQAFSRTYGGRNNPTQIQADAQDLRKAADADLDTWEPVWRQNGWTEADIANARSQVHEYNRRTFTDLGIDYGAD